MVGTAVSRFFTASASQASRRVFVSTASALVLLATLAACVNNPPVVAPAPTSTETVTETPAATSAAPSVTLPNTSPTPNASGSTALGPLTGTWKGTWINESPQTAVGTFSLSWVQQGNQIFGAIGVVGSTCLQGGNVTGSANGSSISFGAVEGNNMINYTGTISGNTMSGTYASAACGPSKGSWSAVKA